MKRALSVSLDPFVLAGAPARLSARLVAAATFAELAGAARVRIQVTEELAPVGAAELRDLRRCARGLELRIAPAPALLKTALEVRPQRVVLAAHPAHGHAHAPLDLAAWSTSLPGVLRTLRDAGIDVAIASAATLDAVKAARGVDAPALELATGALVDLPAREQREALVELADAAKLAAKLRIAAGAGGGLEIATLAALLGTAPTLEWVCVGRALAERALLVGLDRAVRDFLEAGDVH